MKKLLILILIVVAFVPVALAHGASEDEVYVRTVSADPDTRTYTFSCRMNPENTWERAWHIRPDSGTDEYIPDEAGNIRTAADEFLTYTFEEDKFYHVGCLALNPENFSKPYRGDLHIDLRTSSWDPEIVPQYGNGTTATYTCEYTGLATPDWLVLDARTGELTTLPSGNPLTHTVEGHGIYDYICRVDGKATGLPIEYFDEGNPYFPDRYGIPDGVYNTWNGSSTPPSGPDEDEDQENNQTAPQEPDEDSSNETGTVPGEGTCYERLEHMPVTCSAQITQDTFDGCRTVICNSTDGSLQVLACEKPNTGEKEYFEIYKQAESGVAPEICIGGTCLSTSGYARSDAYPWCQESEEESNQTTPPEDSESGNDTTQDPPITEEVCYERLEHMPVSCSGGEISSDEFDGCRAITCGGASGELQVLACEKPNTGEKEYFEMYKRSESGTTPQICIGDTCIQNNGFAQSNNYPICLQATPEDETGSDNQTNITDPEENQTTCYDTLEHIPVSCDGTVTQDSFTGCRNLACETTDGSVQVLACPKPNTGDQQYFEMYKQSSSGLTPQICLGDTCIQNNGYAKSTNYPWCTQETIPDEDTPPLNDSTIPLPEWIEPSQGLTGVPTDYFHLATVPPVDDSHIASSDWEVWAVQSTGGANNSSTIPGREDEVYVRTVSADPDTRTYTFSCRMNPENTWERAWHIRPDSGTDEYIPDEAGDIRTAADEFLTYTFEENKFYHVGCLALNPDNFSKPYRGDLHIDLRTSSWDPEIVAQQGEGTTGTYTCDYSGTGTPEWLVIDARTGELTNLPDGNPLTHTVPGHGIYDYICRVDGKSTGLPIEYFDEGNPYFPDQYGIPDGVYNTYSTEESTDLVEAQRVWHAHGNTGFIKYHTHTPDGVFENQATQLEPLTTYRTRVRYQGVDGEMGPWSEWRSFTTQAPQVSNPSSLDWTAASGYRVEKVAGGFDLPVHLAFAPNTYEHLPANQRPYFYVTELYGQIKTVYPDGTSAIYADNLLNFNPFSSITGAGQMGLVSLYVEPETGDLYAGTVYLEGEDIYNKILKFTTNQDGNSYTDVTTIIDGLPSGPSHQIQEITRGPDGKLYVNLGEGLRPSDAQKDDVLAGKIIRMNMDGSGVEVYAKGFRNPFGADWRPGYDELYVTDNGADSGDRLVKVVQGENYGWGLNDNLETFNEKRIDVLNASPVGVAFNPGHHEFEGELYVGVAGPIYQEGPVNGKHILEYTLDASGEVATRRTFVEYTGSGYGTPIGLRFGADGLYFTDIYGEPGFVGLGETEANIYRVVPGEPIECTDCIEEEFRAGISILTWYPQDAGDGIEYIFVCQGIDGSGNYSYSFDLGNGPFSAYENKQYTKYSYEDVDYTVSCIANDLETGASSGATMTVNPTDFIPEHSE